MGLIDLSRSSLTRLLLGLAHKAATTLLTSHKEIDFPSLIRSSLAPLDEVVRAFPCEGAQYDPRDQTLGVAHNFISCPLVALLTCDDQIHIDTSHKLKELREFLLCPFDGLFYLEVSFTNNLGH